MVVGVGVYLRIQVNKSWRRWSTDHSALALSTCSSQHYVNYPKTHCTSNKLGEVSTRARDTSSHSSLVQQVPNKPSCDVRGAPASKQGTTKIPRQLSFKNSESSFQAISIISTSVITILLLYQQIKRTSSKQKLFYHIHSTRIRPKN